jgi:hypothetical protein
MNLFRLVNYESYQRRSLAAILLALLQKLTAIARFRKNIT